MQQKWFLMPQAEKDKFGSKASAEWLEKQEVVGDDEACTKASSTIAARRLEEVFFGLGSHEWPYTPVNYEAAVQEVLGLHGSLPGHRNHCSALRDVWLKNMLVDGLNDDGVDIIPKGLDVKVRLPCWVDHPGMCSDPEADGWHMAESLPLAKHLTNYLVDKGDIKLGDFFQVEVDCKDGKQRRINLCGGHLRLSHPRAALFVQCRQS